MKQIIYYATGNKDKYLMSKQYLAQTLPEIELRHFEADIPEKQTLDLSEIARDKVTYAHQQTNAPVLADDGGIYFDAYPNFPGTMTKFVYYALGVDALLKLTEENRNAERVLYLAYSDGRNTKLFKGSMGGKLVTPPTPIPEETKVPYNYFFCPSGHNTPYAHLPESEKKPENNYRLQALKQFVSWYKSLFCLFLFALIPLFSVSGASAHPRGGSINKATSQVLNQAVEELKEYLKTNKDVINKNKTEDDKKRIIRALYYLTPLIQTCTPEIMIQAKYFEKKPDTQSAITIPVRRKGEEEDKYYTAAVVLKNQLYPFSDLLKYILTKEVKFRLKCLKASDHKTIRAMLKACVIELRCIAEHLPGFVFSEETIKSLEDIP